MKRALAALATTTLGLCALAGCTSDADTASKNVSTAAEQFEVQRRIVVINTFDNSYLFEVEGRCSIETMSGYLEAICKHGPNEYRKHFLGMADNVAWIVEQLDPIDVDEYHFRIIFKPEAIVPDVDLVTSGDDE